MAVDHATEAVARLPAALRDTTVETLVRVLASSTQSLEDGLGTFTACTLEDGEGVQLDGIGSIVGQPRETTDDEAYRVRLRVRIAINRSGGRTEDVIGTLSLLVPEGGAVYLQESFPAAFRAVVSGADFFATSAELTRILGELKGAGIGAWLRYTNATPANTFTLDGVAGQGLDEGVFADRTRA